MGAKLPPVPREPIGETFPWRDWMTKLQAYISGGIPGLGTVTNVATGTGLTGGPITNTGTISLANQIAAGGPTGSATKVPVITYNAQGQLTAVTTATITPYSIGTPISPVFIMDSQDGEDSYIPGQVGPQGVQGASGLFVVGQDGEDGGDALFGPPGNQGPRGLTGSQGSVGPVVTVEDGKDGEDGMMRVGTGDPMLNVPIINGMGMFQYQFVDAGVTLTVPSNYSMVVAGNFTSNGDLIVNGDMRVL